MANKKSIGRSGGRLPGSTDSCLRQRVKEGFGESDSTAHTVLNALSAHIAILDERGVIVAVNRAWRDFAELNRAVVVEVCEGAHYLAVCDAAQGEDAAQAARFATSVRALLRDERNEFSLEYPCHSPDEQRWFNVRVTRFSDKGAIRIVVAHENITERKQTEQVLRQSEDRFRSLVASSMDAVLLTAPEGRVLAANEAACRMFGLTEQELIQAGRIGVVDATDPRLALALEERTRTGQFRGELAFVRKGGSKFIGDISSSVFIGPHGESFTSLVIRDITERKRAEESLRQSEARFASAFENAAIGMALVSPEGRWLKVNESVCALLGYMAEELMTLTFQDITHPDDLEADLAQVRKLLDDEIKTYQMEKRYIHKSRQVIWCLLSVSLMRDQCGQPLYFISQIQSINERKRAEEALARSEQRFRMLSERSMEGLTLLGEDGTVLYQSPALLYLQGYTPEERDGRDGFELVHPDDLAATKEFFARLLGSAGGSATITVRFRHKDGSWRWFEAVVTNQLAEPAIGAFIINFRDITERKRIETELSRSREALRALTARIESEREKTRTRIAREIHDELGHAMTDLKLDLAWLARRLAEAGFTGRSALRKKIARMSRQAESHAQTVRRIATELRPAVLDALGLPAAIEWQAREFQQRTGVACRVEIPEHSLALKAPEATAMFRVFQEILNNVIQHAQANHVVVRLTIPPGGVVLQVEDNGRGITDAEQSRPNAFGLLGMRERVTALGGEVRIQGSPGRGTTVTVIIPI